MARLISIHPLNPQVQRIEEVVQILQKGGLVIYPTDTVYGVGCDMTNARAVERVYQLKGVKPGKTNFSIICHDLSDIATYALVSNQSFKLMKKALPGPFTFVLPATRSIPKLLEIKKRTIGIRIPNHAIPRMLVELLGNPLITTSLPEDNSMIEYSTDPELMAEKWNRLVDCVLDAGAGGIIPSTIVDLTGNQPEIIREGLGEIEQFL
jgi:tRNA threonylcarbamoyl adenosine modification protein (Sua5/YciO/YrdC/YwlC family)